jgi:eukaryotic-like serine/threonine-protein kinase
MIRATPAPPRGAIVGQRDRSRSMHAHTLINGRYELKDTLGQGGMGVVFRAYDVATKRNVALKTMRDSADPVAVELFAKEWTVLANLSHPNIVDILDSGEFEMSGKRRPYFVMPLLPGKTLDELIRSSSQRLTVERVVEIIVQTCRGLAAAHDRGLVHRDLKPSNIFVMDDDTAKIIDFGVVHLAGSQSISGVKGTLQYMAPEQLELKPATPQSDIFSLGVVTYEALTARKPFARTSEAATAEAVRAHIPPPAGELNPSANELISRVVHKAMAKQPWHRFDSAREFADALRKAVRNEPIERFERSKILPRLQRANRAFTEGDLQFADEILSELEAEGNIDPDMAVLRMQLDQASRHRTVRQLIESARIRAEQEEYPLALQKIQEALAIDPQNGDALRLRGEIEGQRSERQLENWLRLLQEHMHSGAFADARKCIDEALKISPNDTRVRKAQSELQRQEEQVSSARTQKDQLYSAAKEAFQNGEISTALTKLERILALNRTSPDRVFPDRDARYQQLYNQVRSEHDSMRMLYEEARRALLANEFKKALGICDEYLNRFPNQALFQALKLEITEQERQELSAAIAETSRRAEAEPDLDRKLAILKEAADRYPDEPHFQQSLRLLRERRDLVQSIVAKARQYEERGQFTEAIGQWQIVKSIYPPFPGLSFELEQLEKRRELQSRDEAKSRWVSEVEAAIGAGEFEKAQEVAERALAEHPGDPEMEALRKGAGERIAKRSESERLLEEGTAACARADYEAAIKKLRQACELDDRNSAARAELASALAAQARALGADRWEEAEPLVQEALRMDPNHAAARGMRTVIQDSRRRQAVSRSLAEAREHQLRGEYEAAVRKMDECLEAYPNEARLQQLRALLVNAAAEQRAGSQAPSAPQPPPAQPTPATPAPPPAAETLVFSDAAAAQTGEPKSPSSTELLGGSGPPPPAPPLHEQRRPPVPAGAPEYRKRKVPTSKALIAAAIVVPLLAVAAWLIPGFLNKSAPPADPGQTYSLKVAANVPAAVVSIDGQPAGSPPYRLTAGAHTVQVSAEGYRTESRDIVVGPGTGDLRFDLMPELQRVHLITALSRGRVVLDGQDAGELTNGEFVKDDLAAAEHTLQISEGSRNLIDVRFRSNVAEPAQAIAPIATPELLVISSLGNQVRVYAGPGTMKVGLRDQALQTVPPEGLVLQDVAPGVELVANNGRNERVIPLAINNAPALTIIAGDATQSGSLLSITSNVDDAVVAIDNRPSKWRFTRGQLSRRLSPGKYVVKLSREGYIDQEQTVDLTKGDAKLAFELKALPTVASLVIENGTAGAEVWADQEMIGTLDAQGNGNFERVRPGDREISLRRTQFEPKQIGRRSFSAGQAVRLSGDEVKLRAFGTLQFQVTPAEAEIAFRREDETDYRGAKNGQGVGVREGKYRVKATASGYAANEVAFAVEAGKPTAVSLALNRLAETKAETKAPVRDSLFDRTWTRADDGAWTYGGQGYGWMRSNRGSFDIDLEKKGSKLGFGGTIEWAAGHSADGKEKVVYRLGRDGSLRRQVTVNGRSASEVRSTNRVSGEDVFKLRIVIEPQRIVVTDRATGTVVDDYTHLGPDLTQGRFGFQRGVRVLSATQ